MPGENRHKRDSEPLNEPMEIIELDALTPVIRPKTKQVTRSR